MMSIHEFYQRMINRRKEAYRTLGNPSASMAKKRMAMRQIDHIDLHLPSIEKATGRKVKTDVRSA